VSSSSLSTEAVLAYAAKSQHPVATCTPERMRAVTRAEIVTADVGDRAELVRHDPAKLGRSLMGVLGWTP